MNEVSIRTLNQETSKVLARVKRGEEINLTERGKVIARIIPASAGPLDSLISTGSVQPASAWPGASAHNSDARRSRLGNAVGAHARRGAILARDLPGNLGAGQANSDRGRI